MKSDRIRWKGKGYGGLNPFLKRHMIKVEREHLHSFFLIKEENEKSKSAKGTGEHPFAIIEDQKWIGPRKFTAGGIRRQGRQIWPTEFHIGSSHMNLSHAHRHMQSWSVPPEYKY